VGAFKTRWRVAALVIVVVGGCGSAVEAATRTTSFNVTATVVATCALSPALTGGRASPAICQQPQAQGAARLITAPSPVVRVSRDSKSGALVRTVEF
jgi:hypothetical protein